jgi:hypothetical protein
MKKRIALDDLEVNGEETIEGDVERDSRPKRSMATGTVAGGDQHFLEKRAPVVRRSGPGFRCVP